MGALSDKDVAKVIDEHYVATFDQVGNFLVGSSRQHSRYCGPRKRLAKQGGNVVTYFCTPDWKVLHLVVGPVAPADLAAEARWVAETWQANEPADAEDAAVKFRRLHLARHASYPNHTPNAWQAQTDQQWQATLDKQKTAFDKMLATPWEDDSPPVASHSDLLAALFRRTASAGLANQTPASHLLMAEIPLVPLPSIEQHAFRYLARQRFQRRQERNDQLLDLVRMNVESNWATLFVVQGRVNANRRRQVLAKANELSQVGPFEAVELTAIELTTLTDDLNQPPPPTLYGAQPFGFVLLGPKGKEAYWKAGGASDLELANLIRRGIERARPPSGDELAERKMLLARNLIAVNPEAAQRRLQTIIDEHPATESARQAKMLLVKLK